MSEGMVALLKELRIDFELGAINISLLTERKLVANSPGDLNLSECFR